DFEPGLVFRNSKKTLHPPNSANVGANRTSKSLAVISLRSAWRGFETVSILVAARRQPNAGPLTVHIKLKYDHSVNAPRQVAC
ncbi:MAG TPA: hypothetical protein VMG40_13735, partial [Bryobacteraceae bacterium]|nr:hypothetical protein [Bryobacteraceae bacterium]